jgi:Amt family ammonium transporter
MLAMINTFIATAGGHSSAWSAVEALTRGKASMLGAASGMIAGLVAITPAAGLVGPMGAIVLGIAGLAVCYFFVSVVKNKFGYDDTARRLRHPRRRRHHRRFGTGIFTSASLGGVGYVGEQTMGGQLWVQIQAVAITIVWTVIGSAILYKIVDLIVGLRVAVEAEREGLDLASHGEAAYHS